MIDKDPITHHNKLIEVSSFEDDLLTEKDFLDKMQEKNEQDNWKLYIFKNSPYKDAISSTHHVNRRKTGQSKSQDFSRNYQGKASFLKKRESLQEENLHKTLVSYLEGVNPKGIFEYQTRKGSNVTN